MNKMLARLSFTDFTLQKKYEDLIEKITSYRNEYEINKSNCVKLLELNEDIKIGRETLKKIMENKYLL